MSKAPGPVTWEHLLWLVWPLLLPFSTNNVALLWKKMLLIVKISRWNVSNIGWKMAHSSFCWRKMLSKLSKNVLSFFLFTPLVPWKTETSYPRYGVPLSTKTKHPSLSKKTPNLYILSKTPVSKNCQRHNGPNIAWCYILKALLLLAIDRILHAKCHLDPAVKKR